MSKKEDIGKVFKEKLADFNKSPENIDWKDIKTALNKKKKVTQLYWLRISGVLIFISIITIIGIVTLNRTINNIPTQNTLPEHKISYDNQQKDCEDILSEIDPHKENTSNINTKNIDQIAEEKIVSHTSSSLDSYPDKKEAFDKKPNTIHDSSFNSSKSTNIKNDFIVNQEIGNRISETNKESNDIINDILLKKGFYSPEKSEKENISESKSEILTNVTHTKTENKAITIDHRINSKNETQRDTITISNLNKTSTSNDNKKPKNQTSIDISTINTSDKIGTLENKNGIKKDKLEEKSMTKTNTSKKSKKDTLIYLHPLKKDTLIYMNPVKKKARIFNFALHIIPTYAFPPNGSIISNRLVNNSKNGKLSFNYGGVLTANITDKIGLRVGYNRLKFETRTNNIKNDTIAIANALLDSGILLLNSTIQNIANQNVVSLAQKLDYHEISTELSYKLIDKKFRLDLIGGFSFLVLQKNNIKLQAGSEGFSLGTNKNVERNNTSINFGSNLKYKLFNNLFLSVEPTFKYQLKNASTNSESYKPFYFTIPVGLSIDF